MSGKFIAGTDVAKRKAWSIRIGMVLGLATGGLLWLEAYEPGGGLMQNLRLLVGPIALGVGFVVVRNWYRQVGPFDPELIDGNKRGRV